MIDGNSAENPMRMTKFAAHARMSRSHTRTYGGSEVTPPAFPRAESVSVGSGGER